MKVKVKLLGILSLRCPAFSRFQCLELEEKKTVGDLREYLGLTGEVCFVSVNGKVVEEGHELAEGDEVIFIPAASGG
ncbi:MoaD/ThiS family protein [Thermosediminibacter oceani]|uniref:ThiamineS protein n=1 Tax=Thermosediminibacter oceani (strain ATCC BAA-1034 / DSM 16646 / JW/IW-1228P) TaxID=555079 RepID=D9S101_THEOJ|nr:MoaD/ThiS family protein [Thermosediminibacter oceani]ADL07165.1 thiamineS protein [Thermosediminibacter oceani DSM 16646]